MVWLRQTPFMQNSSLQLVETQELPPVLISRSLSTKYHRVLKECGSSQIPLFVLDFKSEINGTRNNLPVPFLSPCPLPNCFLGSKLSSREAGSSTTGGISKWKLVYPDASRSGERSVFTLFLSKSFKALGAGIMKWCLSRKMCHWRGHFAFLGTPCWLEGREEKLCAVAEDTAAGRKQSFFLFCSFWHLVGFIFSLNAVWKRGYNNNMKIKVFYPWILTSCQSSNITQTCNHSRTTQRFWNTENKLENSGNVHIICTLLISIDLYSEIGITLEYTFVVIFFSGNNSWSEITRKNKYEGSILSHYLGYFGVNISNWLHFTNLWSLTVHLCTFECMCA